MMKDRNSLVKSLISQALTAAQVASGSGASRDFTSGPLRGALRQPDSVGEAAFNSAVQKLIAASGGKIKVTSGKRSNAKQSQLWAAALKKYGDPEIADNYVARPGTSHHEQGIAADLHFVDPATRQWAHSVAGQYGLYFPMGHEPWHVEPVSTRKSKKK